MSDKKTVLVVEDEQTLAEALEMKLKEIGLEVIIAMDGEEALAKALAEHPDMILMDIMMPKMDGLTFIEKLRKDKWGKTAKALVLTNVSESSTAKKAKDLGVLDYMVKSNWTIEDLSEKVRFLLEDNKK